MPRIVIIYGVILAVAAFSIAWLDYKFWMRDIGFEVYGLGLAVLFAGLGIWIERQRSASRANNTPPSGLNEKAIKALGLTQREMDVLTCLARGQSNKEIALSLIHI